MRLRSPTLPFATLLAFAMPAILPALESRLQAASDAAVARREAGLEHRMLHDAADGRLDSFAPFEAALIAGGCTDPAELADALRRVEQLAAELPRNVEQPFATAAAAHRLLHERVLQGPFRDDTGEIAETLHGGAYNCLTATLLLNELCRRRGLQATAMLVPGHVFTRIQASPPFDVQITCADWFSGVSGPNALTGCESTSDAGPRELTDVQLLARIYYNRGVAAHRNESHAPAVELLHTAVLLDPSDAAARGNLLAAINNRALAECDAGDYRQAMETLALGRGLEPGYEPFQENDVFILGCWADALCQQRQYAAALALLREGQRRHPRQEFFSRAVRAVQAAQAAAPNAGSPDLTVAGM